MEMEWYTEEIPHSGALVCTAWLPNGQLMSKAYYGYTEDEANELFEQVLLEWQEDYYADCP